MSKRAEARVVLFSEEMECDEFDYLRWFPEGADEFKPKVDVTVEIEPLTVRQFHNEWIEKKRPPFVRLSLQRDYQQNFKKNILPFMATGS